MALWKIPTNLRQGAPPLQKIEKMSKSATYRHLTTRQTKFQATLARSTSLPKQDFRHHSPGHSTSLQPFFRGFFFGSSNYTPANKV